MTTPCTHAVLRSDWPLNFEVEAIINFSLSCQEVVKSWSETLSNGSVRTHNSANECDDKGFSFSKLLHVINIDPSQALREIKPTDGCDSGKKPANKDKNRYRNVLPCT